MFFFTGLLFWARVIDPGPLRPRLELAGADRLRASARWSSAGGSRSRSCSPRDPLYAHYAALAHRPGGISALTDQQIAAGMMWVPGLALVHDRVRLSASTAGSSPTERDAAPRHAGAHDLRRTHADMPTIPFADNFLAGSILISLLIPIVLLIALAVWYVLAVKRVPEGATKPLPPGRTPGHPHPAGRPRPLPSLPQPANRDGGRRCAPTRGPQRPAAGRGA